MWSYKTYLAVELQDLAHCTYWGPGSKYCVRCLVQMFPGAALLANAGEGEEQEGGRQPSYSHHDPASDYPTAPTRLFKKGNHLLL